jgi:type III secretion protein L
MDEKIIKGDIVRDKAALSSPKVLKREVYEATREAHDVVALAQQSARKIIEEAERDKAAIFEQAKSDGRVQGLAEWNQLLQQARQKAEELSVSWEQNMLRVAVRIAEKIVGEELKSHPEVIVEIVSEALRANRPGKHLVFQVNEGDVDILRNRIDVLKRVAVTADVEIVASAKVAPGGCLIESELGIIDARLDTQLKLLEEVLVKSVSAD